MMGRWVTGTRVSQRCRKLRCISVLSRRVFFIFSWNATRHILLTKPAVRACDGRLEELVAVLIDVLQFLKNAADVRVPLGKRDIIQVAS